MTSSSLRKYIIEEFYSEHSSFYFHLFFFYKLRVSCKRCSRHVYDTSNSAIIDKVIMNKLILIITATIKLEFYMHLNSNKISYSIEIIETPSFIAVEYPVINK